MSEFGWSMSMPLAARAYTSRYEQKGSLDGIRGRNATGRGYCCTLGVQTSQIADSAPKGKIPVAFLISDDAQVIDLAGPWEVFQDVHVRSRGTTMDEWMPFQLFTVAQSSKPIRATGGLKIVPDYDFASAPQAKLIVIPAQGGPTDATKAWLRKSAQLSDVTMSVCTGAFVLGATGMLSGQAATTHHEFYDEFAKAFPDIQLQRGVRFVDNGKLATAGGLTSGIDLALHVVERYFGAEVAQQTATFMEHDSSRWRV